MAQTGCVSGAGIHPFRTWVSGSSESAWWNAIVHRPDLGLYSHPKEFLGYGVRTYVNSKWKIPSTGSSEEDRTHDAASRRTARPTYYWAIPAPDTLFLSHPFIPTSTLPAKLPARLLLTFNSVISFCRSSTKDDGWVALTSACCRRCRTLVSSSDRSLIFFSYCWDTLLWVSRSWRVRRASSSWKYLSVCSETVLFVWNNKDNLNNNNDNDKNDNKEQYCYN